MKTEDTKQKILKEALKLFSQDGYEAVSVDQIAKAVGIKAPSIYKHYKSKRDIFDHILERMNEMDLERAKEYEMPDGNIEKIAVAYRETPLEKIKTYSISLFLHWTEEEFSSSFRKMLTLEQYRNPEMSQLYQQYLATGPLKYMAKLFHIMTEDETNSMQIALEFYGPIFLLYSVYDGAVDKNAVVASVDKHIDRFSQQICRTLQKERIEK